MVMLPLSVTVVASRLREKAFFTALYVMAVGEGGHKPCVMTFAADQFGEASAEEKATKTSFFNYWYLSIVLGSSIAVLVLIFIQVLLYFYLFFLLCKNIFLSFVYRYLKSKRKICCFGLRYLSLVRYIFDFIKTVYFKNNLNLNAPLN